MWVATTDLPRSAAHPFYMRLNQILDQHEVDHRELIGDAPRHSRQIGPPSVKRTHLDRRPTGDGGLAPPRQRLVQVSGYPSRRASVGSTRTARRAGPAAESRPMVMMKMAAAGRIPGMCHPPSTSMFSLR